MKRVLNVISTGMIVCALALFLITENFPQIWGTVFKGTATDNLSLTMEPFIMVLALGRIIPLILILCALCVVLYICIMSAVAAVVQPVSSELQQPDSDADSGGKNDTSPDDANESFDEIGQNDQKATRE